MTEFAKIASFYGLSEKEMIRRHGSLLESNLQAFEDAMRESIVRKVVEQPENWTDQAKALAKELLLG